MAAWALLFPGSAASLDWKSGELSVSLDTTLSYGLTFRVQDRDLDLIGVANGGRAFSVNGDDGNLNYDTGVVSNTPKITSELELRYKNFGAFVRGRAFYDITNEEADRARTPLSDAALDRVGSRVDLLDAFAWVKFDLGDVPVELRAGNQVLSWGESTFIGNSINTINPIDVAAIRVPGAELREALLPEWMIWGSISPTANLTLEGFYLLDWNDTEIDPPGSYFSAADFVGDGGELVFLGFGASSDQRTFPGTDQPFLAVRRDPEQLPDSSGQFGAALRWFIPALNETEIGLFFINYHSRLPVLNGRTGTLAGAGAAQGFGVAGTVALQTFAGSGDQTTAIAAGTAAGIGAGLSVVQAATVAAAVVQTAAGGGNAAAVIQAFATDAYAQTAGYFTAFPEDIKLFGLSFNTQLGTSGIALQGEVSHRTDAPFQMDDVELLFAALSPISAGLRATSQIIANFGPVGLNQVVPGFIERDMTQAQMTATKVFGPRLGWDTAVLLAEVAGTFVHDLPDKEVLRMEGPGTYTSGNPVHAAAGGAHAGAPEEAPEHFADGTSWGYRIASRADYNNAIGAFNISPSLSWQHDVGGVSPGPGGNFIEGRKALSVGLRGAYQNTWEVEVSYTNFFGASRYNLNRDRDFVGFNLKYSF
jgi:hypothetical protein